jgi:hypothetical protein
MLAAQNLRRLRRQINLVVHERTCHALTEHAREKGLTLKQTLVQALQKQGLEVDPRDLENHTPWRRLTDEP